MSWCHVNYFKLLAFTPFVIGQWCISVFAIYSRVVTRWVAEKRPWGAVVLGIVLGSAFAGLVGIKWVDTGLSPGPRKADRLLLLAYYSLESLVLLGVMVRARSRQRALLAVERQGARAQPSHLVATFVASAILSGAAAAVRTMRAPDASPSLFIDNWWHAFAALSGAFLLLYYLNRRRTDGHEPD